MIAPHLKKRAEWWDNQSSKYSITSANRDDSPTPENVSALDIWRSGWKSVDACEAACISWDDCMQWSFVEDLCKMDDKVAMGRGYAPTMSQRKTALMSTSGWLKERIETWQCD